ncbi:MAG: 3-methyl-2-oxobutanoate dehydrogenase subunit VorB [Defluviitaleaceae bacterium]|nr:3-methyl-2-oxobutanoate dehydrogenase subunit VorB [Defluviitaleaceae bacterium]MCL2835152.1 3-methyl-2-oxobutanoate dehydrogenase subunit VorB [Defluviitaleaceae bacterium]
MKTLMKGNEAVSAAAIAAGCKAFFGYPITPQNEIPEYMSAKMAESGGVFVQAESEIAAINMIYGGAAAGARVMTSSSSPGIALKQEGISYLCAARLPCLIVSVMRCGPGLGGILPSQADYFQATRGGGNGDYNTPVYAPNSIQEATDLVQKAFNVAEQYRTPVMVVMDGLLGQMMEPAEIKPIPRFKNDTDKYATNGESGRRGRNIVNSLNLQAAALEQSNLRLAEVYKEIIKNEVMYESTVEDGDELVIAAYGTPSRIAQNAVAELRARGIKTGLIRPVTLWPFPDLAFQSLPSSVKNVLVCELSMGQMVQDVRLALNGKLPVHFYGRTGGVIFEPEEIVEKALEIAGGGQ